MSKEDMIEVEGKVVEALPGATFTVELDNGHQIQAHISGKLRMNYIKILPGDTVKLEMSPYDLTKGRIIWRAKQFKLKGGVYNEGKTFRKTDVRKVQNYQKKRQDNGYLQKPQA